MKNTRLPSAIDLYNNPNYRIINNKDIDLNRIERSEELIQENQQMKTYLLLALISLSISIVYLISKSSRDDRKKIN